MIDLNKALDSWSKTVKSWFRVDYDAIDNALQYYQDYHYDAIQRTYVSHQVTSTDKTNKYITIDDSITGIINIFPVSSIVPFPLKPKLRCLLELPAAPRVPLEPSEPEEPEEPFVPLDPSEPEEPL